MSQIHHPFDLRTTLRCATSAVLLLLWTLWSPPATSQTQSNTNNPVQREAGSEDHPELDDPPSRTDQTADDSSTMRLRDRDSPPRYQLRKGDKLKLSFPFVKGSGEFRGEGPFDQTVTVMPDGYITLRGVADLWVEGKTLPEVTEALQKQYAAILKDPVITVELEEYEKPYFIVNGEVKKPGKYDLTGPTTVSQALAIAGGFTMDRAKHSQVLLFRSVSDEWVKVHNIDIRDMLAKANLGEDLRLQPGDMIYVPQNFHSKIKDYIPRAFINLFPGIY